MILIVNKNTWWLYIHFQIIFEIWFLHDIQNTRNNYKLEVLFFRRETALTSDVVWQTQNLLVLSSSMGFPGMAQW